MAIRATTATLPVVNGSHADFPVLITEGAFPTNAIDGGPESIKNGGVNLRAYTDSSKNVEIPIDVIEFTTGVSPSIQIKVKLPLAFTAATIYFEADDAVNTLPPFTDPNGRNAVYPNHRTMLHLSDQGLLVDSSGNQDGVNDTGTVLSVTRPGPWGKQVAEFRDAERVRVDNSLELDTTSLTISIWMQRDNSDEAGIIGSEASSAPDDIDLAIRQDAVGFETGRTNTLKVAGSTFTSEADQNNVTTVGVWEHIMLAMDSGGNDLYVNGVSVPTLSDPPSEFARWLNAVTGPVYVSYSRGVGLLFDGGLAEYQFYKNVYQTQAWAQTEYENQIDPDNWVTMGLWEEVTSASCETSGTAVPTSTETDIVNGGRTIILTLTGDTWVAAGPTFDAVRQDIINGLNSAQSELTGWNNEVRDKEVVTAVVRTSATVVTITLSPSPLYDITATETITATVPASALVTSTNPIVSSPTFTVTSISPAIAIPVIINANQLIGGGNGF